MSLLLVSMLLLPGRLVLDSWNFVGTLHISPLDPLIVFEYCCWNYCWCLGVAFVGLLDTWERVEIMKSRIRVEPRSLDSFWTVLESRTSAGILLELITCHWNDSGPLANLNYPLKPSLWKPRLSIPRSGPEPLEIHSTPLSSSPTKASRSPQTRSRLSSTLLVSKTTSPSTRNSLPRVSVQLDLFDLRLGRGSFWNYLDIWKAHMGRLFLRYFVF